jgi:uncharacterized membrane protein
MSVGVCVCECVSVSMCVCACVSMCVCKNPKNLIKISRNLKIYEKFKKSQKFILKTFRNPNFF